MAEEEAAKQVAEVRGEPLSNLPNRPANGWEAIVERRPLFVYEDDDHRRAEARRRCERPTSSMKSCYFPCKVTTITSRETTFLEVMFDTSNTMPHVVLIILTLL